MLLVERARPPEAGAWSIPGGRIEPGERATDAVEREVREETGLLVRCGELVGWAERITAERHFVILDFSVEVISESEPIAGDDARKARWVPLGDVRGLGLATGLGDFLERHGLLPAPA
jgi:8-oxo-dGTP diphosphatase